MRFGCSRMGTGGLYALDDFHCSSSHVASGFQLAHRRGADPFASGCGAGGTGHQSAGTSTRSLKKGGNTPETSSRCQRSRSVLAFRNHFSHLRTAGTARRKTEARAARNRASTKSEASPKSRRAHIKVGPNNSRNNGPGNSGRRTRTSSNSAWSSNNGKSKVTSRNSTLRNNAGRIKTGNNGPRNDDRTKTIGSNRVPSNNGSRTKTNSSSVPSSNNGKESVFHNSASSSLLTSSST